jgi:hypothetical protein
MVLGTTPNCSISSRMPSAFSGMAGVALAYAEMSDEKVTASGLTPVSSMEKRTRSPSCGRPGLALA